MKHAEIANHLDKVADLDKKSMRATMIMATVLVLSLVIIIVLEFSDISLNGWGWVTIAAINFATWVNFVSTDGNLRIARATPPLD